MITEDDTWTQAHDLALIFVALAYGTDHQLSDEELDLIVEALDHWRGGAGTDEVREVVMEAMVVYLEQGAGEEVLRSMESLSASLSLEERRRALEDAVRIAEADGVLLRSEQHLISTLADIWDLKSSAQHLIETTSVTREGAPAWSLMHDISLMYVVMAHSTDNELSDPEIEAILDRLRHWHPDLEDEDVRDVLRTTLQFYAEEPEAAALQRSVSTIREGLPVVQRLALLDDLVYIAQVDGAVNDHARDLMDNLSRAWGVDVRLDDTLDS